MEQKQTFGACLLILTQFGLRDFFGDVGMVSLLFGQITEQLADANILRTARSDLIELLGLEFHAFRCFLDGLQAEWPNELNGAAIHEPAHVLPADERDVVAELLPVEVDEPVAVAVLVRLEDPEPLG